MRHCQGRGLIELGIGSRAVPGSQQPRGPETVRRSDAQAKPHGGEPGTVRGPGRLMPANMKPLPACSHWRFRHFGLMCADMRSLIPILLGAALTARAQIHTETIEYKQGDTVLEGFLAYDASIKGKRPGVLIMHQWKGLDGLRKEASRDARRARLQRFCGGYLRQRDSPAIEPGSRSPGRQI